MGGNVKLNEIKEFAIYSEMYSVFLQIQKDDEQLGSRLPAFVKEQKCILEFI